MRMLEIREAPVPVKAWNEEGRDDFADLRRLGWPCNQKYAAEQLATRGRRSRLFIELSNGQTIIVRAKP